MQVDTLPVTGSRATQFFVAIAIVMVVFMAIGFGPSLYLRPIFGTVDRFGPHLPIHLIAHGAALTAVCVVRDSDATRKDGPARSPSTTRSAGRRRRSCRRRDQRVHAARGRGQSGKWRRLVGSTLQEFSPG
jgi:hypothetical protein